VPRAKPTTATIDDDIDPGPEPSGFTLTGPQFELDAVHLARAVAATLTAVDPDEPRLQLETFPDGLLVVGTDRYSLLTAWVPWPTGGGWEATQNLGDPRPALDAEPTGIYTAVDDDTTLARWCAHYGKASRAKDKPKERVTIELGELDTEQPVLSADLTPIGVRFGGDSMSTVLPATRGDGAIDWRIFARQVDSAPPAAGHIAIGGNRLAQLGKVANAIGHERTAKLHTRELAAGAVTVVEFAGFPSVSGFIASPIT